MTIDNDTLTALFHPRVARSMARLSSLGAYRLEVISISVGGTKLSQLQLIVMWHLWWALVHFYGRTSQISL